MLDFKACFILATGLIKIIAVVHILNKQVKLKGWQQFYLLQCSRYLAAEENLALARAYLSSENEQIIYRDRALHSWISRDERERCLGMSHLFIVHREINENLEEGIPNRVIRLAAADETIK